MKTNRSQIVRMTVPVNVNLIAQYTVSRFVFSTNRMKFKKKSNTVSTNC